MYRQHFPPFVSVTFRRNFRTIYDCREKIKERKKKIPYIKGNIADSIHSFPSPFFHESCLFSIPLDYVWPRLLRRLINVKLIGKHGWVPVLRANFRSSGSRRKESLAVSRNSWPEFSSSLIRHHRMVLSHETNSIF